VSAQAAPNLLPALDPDLRPQDMVLLVSNKMQPQADALKGVLIKRGISVSCVQLADEHDFESLRTELTSLALERLDARLALNVTGGTKLMALAANSVVAKDSQWEVFYVNADTDEVIVLSPESRRKVLSTVLGMSDYFRSYGYEPLQRSARGGVDEARVRLMEELVIEVDRLAQPLGQLNWLAEHAKSRPRFRIELSTDQQDSRGLDRLLQDFAGAGVLSIDGPVVCFASETDRAFAQGTWFEEFVARRVGSAKEDLGIRDHAPNVVVRGRRGEEHELDVAFMARNRLHVIECKTARMDGPRAAKANDVLFKVAEITRNVGGLGARAMLASYRTLNEYERDLARALNINVVSGADLHRLKERLKAWVQS
jgi:hypothetical protein